MAREPRKGTFDYTVRDVAEREGWSEHKAKAILKDGFDNGHRDFERQRRLEREGIEELRDRGEM